MSDSIAGAADTLAWSLQEYTRLTGCSKAREAGLLILILGAEHPRAVESFTIAAQHIATEEAGR